MKRDQKVFWQVKELFGMSLEVPTLVMVRGWVRSKRVSKKRAFISLSDGSFHQPIQCMVEAESPGFQRLGEVTTGSAIVVQGRLLESPGAGQTREIVATDVTLLGHADGDYPLQKKSHSLEYLREIAHFRPRSQTISSVLRVRHALSYATHEFFHNLGLYWVHTPILTASDGEGAGDMFTVTTLDLDAPLPRDNKGNVDFAKDFFSRRAYLSVTGQLQAEYLAMGLGGVYTFGPTFRAENSHTKRHLAEFWMIEPEVAFANLDDCIELATAHYQYLLRAVLNQCQGELEFFAGKNHAFSIKHLEGMAATKSFERMSYDEALRILAKDQGGSLEPLEWGEDLGREHEKFLCETVVGGPLFVTDYPKQCKAFYMRANDDNKTVACFDFLVPKCGELIGGSQREERWNQLSLAMKSHGIAGDLSWYQDLRKQGSVIHSGYGMGLERMVLVCSGVENVRDTIPSPRTPGNISF